MACNRDIFTLLYYYYYYHFNCNYCCHRQLPLICTCVSLSPFPLDALLWPELWTLNMALTVRQSKCLYCFVSFGLVASGGGSRKAETNPDTSHGCRCPPHMYTYCVLFPVEIRYMSGLLTSLESKAAEWAVKLRHGKLWLQRDGLVSMHYFHFISHKLVLKYFDDVQFQFVSLNFIGSPYRNRLSVFVYVFQNIQTLKGAWDSEISPPPPPHALNSCCVIP
jgi:hypothetical protein